MTTTPIAMNATRPLHIDRRMHGLRVRDVFFADHRHQAARGQADLMYFLQSPVGGAGCSNFYTSQIDLRRDAAALAAGLSKGFRYEIRRAGEKDGVATHVDLSPSGADLERFAAFYDRFATAKSIPLANRQKLAHLATSNGLVLATVEHGSSGQELATHAYIVDGQRARLYYSANAAGSLDDSAMRQLAGRANKLLHWKCILEFKSRDFALYDLGGISMGEALKAIDDFKQQFGGSLVLEFNKIVGITVRGRLALQAFRMAQWARLRLHRGSARTHG